MLPGGQPGLLLGGQQHTKRLEALGISPRQARGTAPFGSAARRLRGERPRRPKSRRD